MIPYIVAFRRSGTHYLAALLHRNLETGVEAYGDLHYSHREAPSVPYICIRRRLLPTMLSLWRVRQQFGMNSSVTFDQMVSTPASALPRCVDAYSLFDGEMRSGVRQPHEFPGTWPEWWLDCTERFARFVSLVFDYDRIVAEPYATVRSVADFFELPSKPTFSLVSERVGWTEVVREEPQPSIAALELLLRIQARSSM